ncbi:MAG: hypothetical protein R3D57_13660 [Hyphomicrobiaceae bacterium]
MRKRTMIVWTMALVIGMSVQAIASAMPSVELHALISAMICLVIAVLAVRENEAAPRSDADVYALSATNARYMGIVWAWGAVTLTLTYALVLHWPEWWHFVLPFSAAAVLCLCFANLLTKGIEKSTAERILKISRFLAIVQLVGAVAAMVGLFIDGKLPFLTGMPSLIEGHYRLGAKDWAANDVFFFGAAALAVISAVALRSYNRALNTDRSSVGLVATR